MHTTRDRSRVAIQHGLAGLILTALAGFLSCHPVPDTPVQEDLAFQVPGRDLRVDPPVASALEIQLLPTATEQGNALLMMTPAEKALQLKTFKAADGNRVITLNDEGRDGDAEAGDGVLTGIFQLDVASIEQNQREILAAARETNTPLEVPVFSDRQLLGTRRLKFIDPRQLTPGKTFDFRDIVLSFPFLISEEKSLVVTDPSVVGDPTRTYDPCSTAALPPGEPLRKWSFGYLMQEMYNNSAPGVTSSEFVERWLQQWVNDQAVDNGLSIAARNQILADVINPWRAASGGGALDLRKAPFKLAAIVNRVDLASNPVYGGGDGGELRFVFGLTRGTGASCSVEQFAVIFEYGVPVSGCQGLKSWAQSWFDLGALALGSPAYNAALEALTEAVVARGRGGSKVNGSAINQIRTNEIALTAPWELREFHLGSDHFLHSTNVAQTPREALNNTITLRDYINGDSADIVQQRHEVPLTVGSGGTTPFRESSSLYGSSGHIGHYSAPGLNPVTISTSGGSKTFSSSDVRHLFSLQTCSGCHFDETRTRFLHIDPTTSPATLSRFMTGETGVPDPEGGSSHSFDDLLRRRQKLDEIRRNQCFIFIGRELTAQVQRIPDGGPVELEPELSSLPSIGMVH